MNASTRYTARIAAIVALGGFLMGFDASVISGVVGFIEIEFALDSIELGWAVSSLALASTGAMLAAGPLSDRFGRRPLLAAAASLYLLSALASALAPSFTWLVVARMVGGLGVGTALIIAPMYIAELSAPSVRGRLVSINQLNIVIGISVAFFTNYLILTLGKDGGMVAETLQLADWNWRWMLGIEAIPAAAYLLGLRYVPESPRWLVMHGRQREAREVLARSVGDGAADQDIASILASQEQKPGSPGLKALFARSLRAVLLIGVVVAVLQQITGINSVFFYAPMIFEQSGIGTDAAFLQAILVGLTNLVFTIIAMMLIDRIGRRPLLLAGVTGIAVSMCVLAFGFAAATFTVPDGLSMPGGDLSTLYGTTFLSDTGFRQAIISVNSEGWFNLHESELVRASIQIDATLILVGVLSFVASFAVSIGPVMWVLFSELFPNHVRALAISAVGLINSGVSFGVQLVFPWELANLGAATTFGIYALFAVIGLALVAWLLPETRGRSLEELERVLVHRGSAVPG